MATHLSYPPYNIKEMPIDRFYDLPQNPQEPIFYDFASNTKLEAKDNHVYVIRKLTTTDPTVPKECTSNTKCTQVGTKPCHKGECDYYPSYATRAYMHV
jgi:hypothetical protein